jgi:xanthine/uracil/vitamin C permease (AzgA family)
LFFSAAHAAVVVSFFFLVSLFFSPILASIPPYASALAAGLGCHQPLLPLC